MPGLSPGTPYYIRAAGVTEFGRTHYSELSTPISTTRKSSPTPLYLCSVLQYVIPCFVLPVTHWCRVRVFFVWFLLKHVLDPPPKKKHTHTYTHEYICTCTHPPHFSSHSLTRTATIPGPLILLQAFGTSLVFSWSQPSPRGASPITGYQLEGSLLGANDFFVVPPLSGETLRLMTASSCPRCCCSGCVFVNFEQVCSCSLSRRVQSLLPGRKYEWRLAALNIGGRGPYRTTQVIPSVPGAPSTPIYSPLRDTELTTQLRIAFSTPPGDTEVRFAGVYVRF